MSDANYEAPVVTEMVIRSNEAKMEGWRHIKGKAAKEAVEAVKAVKAVPAEVDEDGNEITPAVEAVKAVKAQEAVEGTPGCQRIHVQAKTEEILDECVARLADQGFHFPDTEAPAETPYGVGMWITIGPEKEDMTALRQAFKKVKGKDHYNKPGLDALKEEEKAKKAQEKAAAKEKEEAKLSHTGPYEAPDADGEDNFDE